MKAKVNRELKYFAKDFAGIRKELKLLGSKLAEEKSQTDYFYHVPEADHLLKLREENDKQHLIYYYPVHNQGQREVKFHLWEIKDSNTRAIFDTVLKPKGVVKKTREKWANQTAVFHLDTVEGVGKIFEIETQSATLADMEKLRKIFLPYLGAQIEVSNIDLVNKNK